MNQTLQRLKEVRLILKKSKAAFAKMLDIPQPTYLRYEAGTQKLSSNLIKALILKCNLNINWLYTGEGNMFIKKYTYTIKEKPIENLFNINEKIKFLIEKNQMNKLQFAMIVNCDKDRLDEILQNKSLPTTEELFKISQNFDISINWLLNYDNKM